VKAEACGKTADLFKDASPDDWAPTLVIDEETGQARGEEHPGFYNAPGIMDDQAVVLSDATLVERAENRENAEIVQQVELRAGMEVNQMQAQQFAHIDCRQWMSQMRLLD